MSERAGGRGWRQWAVAWVTLAGCDAATVSAAGDAALPDVARDTARDDGPESLDAPRDAHDVVAPDVVRDAPPLDAADHDALGDAPPDVADADAEGRDVAEPDARLLDVLDTSLPDARDAATDDAPRCDAGLAACDGRCVDLATDAVHCGACDRRCAASERCQRGACGARGWSVRLRSSGWIRADIDVDAAGSVVVAGDFAGTVDMGGGPLTATGTWSLFVARYEPNGTHRWSARYGSSGHAFLGAVRSDASSNATLIGFFWGDGLDFGGGPLVEPTGVPSGFGASLGPDGAHRRSWLVARLLSPAARIQPDVLALDAAGGFAVAGFMASPLDFGDGPDAPGLPTAHFLATYSPAGTLRWSRRIQGERGGGVLTPVTGVALDAAGNVYITARIVSAVSLAGTRLADMGRECSYVASYSPSGALRWARRVGSSEQALVEALAVTPGGLVYAAGRFNGTLETGAATLTSAARNGFLLALDTDGVTRWSRRLGGEHEAGAYALALGPTGDAIVAGNFQGDADFGGRRLSSAGGRDAFVAAFAPDGALRWVRRLGGSGNDSVSGAFSNLLAIDAAGHVYGFGTFSDGVDFGAGPVALGGDGAYMVFQLGE